MSGSIHCCCHEGRRHGRSFRFIAFRCAPALPLCWVACVLSNTIALAQSEKTTTFQAGCSADSAPCSKGMVIGFQGNSEVVKNQPYKAQATTETSRTLADGSHITQSTTAMIARDSEGRTVNAQKVGDSLTITTIFDPVAKTHTDYTSDTKIAHVLALPTPTASPSQVPVAMSAAVSGFAAGSARRCRRLLCAGSRSFISATRQTHHYRISGYEDHRRDSGYRDPHHQHPTRRHHRKRGRSDHYP